MKPLTAGAPLIALFFTLVASPADAQRGRGRSTPPSAMLPVPRQSSTVAPTPTFPSNPFRVPANGRLSPFDARPYTYAPRYAPRYGGWSRPLRPYGYGYGAAGYAYGYGYGLPYYSTGDLSAVSPGYDATNVDSPYAAYPEASLGRLFIDTEPAAAQIYVDGIPTGTVADFRGVGMELTEGVRHVELRAPGFEGASFDINILSQQPAVYRGDLTPLRQTTGQPAAAVRRGSDTFYVIPGCYLGNRPPSEVSLPPGCDVQKVRTIK
jgi:hypothetical protein